MRIGFWTKSENATLKRLQAEHVKPIDMMPHLPGRSLHSINGRIHYQRATTTRAEVGVGWATRNDGPVVPPTLIEERERLSEARDRRTITQTFFGDPPPGYSALDRRATR